MSIQLFPHRNALYEIFPKEAVGAECGVEHGFNAVKLHEITQPRQLYLCDKWEVSNEQDAKNKFPDMRHVVTVKRGDVGWLQSLEDGALDWIYIDTLHNYEHTNHELLACRGKVTQIVAGHDFMCADHLHPKHWVQDGGVLRAVIEHIQAGWLELIAMTVCEPFPSFCCKVKQ